MTRLQKLPFDRLSWQNFERLCFRLASRNDQAEDWQRYGRPGQAQSGIDIFVRRADGRYDVWQCKHYRRCGPAQVREAASIFMAGESVGQSATLTLCVSVGLDDVAVQKEVEEQRRHLPALGVVFMAKGGDRLSEELKTHPDIVDDFFGREWVRAVCGEDAVESLRRMRQRLDGAAVARLRDSLLHFYNEYFMVLDRGFAGTPTQPGEAPAPPPLLERFAIPMCSSAKASCPPG